MLIKGDIQFQLKQETGLEHHTWLRTAWYNTRESAHAAIEALKRSGWTTDQCQCPLFEHFSDEYIDKYPFFHPLYAWKIVSTKKDRISERNPRIRLRNST